MTEAQLILGPRMLFSARMLRSISPSTTRQTQQKIDSVEIGGYLEVRSLI
jgi:hypothetical protein